MTTYRLILIGLGHVARGFLELLQEHGRAWEERFGARFAVVAACTRTRGSVRRELQRPQSQRVASHADGHPDGLDPAALLAAARLDDVPGEHGAGALELIEACPAEVVLELSPTDLATGEPALSHVRAALEAGKHVVTANKGPIALAWPALRALAAERGLFLGIEGTVLSGTPALALVERLRAGGVRRLEGLLNGTTNYILTQMEAGRTYAAALAEALAEAQARGYAEADPTADVEGLDAAAKLVILAHLVFGEPLALAQVRREGLGALSAQQVGAARSEGRRWKHLAVLERTGAGLRASVTPVALPLDHPLAAVSGTTNALTVASEALGPVTLVGAGAGRRQTGYAIVQDLLELHRRAGGSR